MKFFIDIKSNFYLTFSPYESNSSPLLLLPAINELRNTRKYILTAPNFSMGQAVAARHLTQLFSVPPYPTTLPSYQQSFSISYFFCQKHHRYNHFTSIYHSLRFFNSLKNILKKFRLFSTTIRERNNSLTSLLATQHFILTDPFTFWYLWQYFSGHCR